MTDLRPVRGTTLGEGSRDRVSSSSGSCSPSASEVVVVTSGAASGDFLFEVAAGTLLITEAEAAGVSGSTSAALGVDAEVEASMEAVEVTACSSEAAHFFRTESRNAWSAFRASHSSRKSE